MSQESASNRVSQAAGGHASILVGEDVRQGIAPALPIHFFTIVLNGEPFIRHHIEVFKQMPFPWRWHVVEGVADLKHDTAWSLQLGGNITDELHRNGRSNDGTTDYLDKLAAVFPKNVTIYRKPEGVFWDGKLEMVNAPLVNIGEECLLWQVDFDELWTIDQLCAARLMFAQHPERTAAYYFCHYFVGEKLVTTTRDTYGNNIRFEWLRTWRYKPSFRWMSHEPPQLCGQTADGRWVDVATINPFKQNEAAERNLIFQHAAYVTERQLRFKEVYYGYANAIKQWRALQRCARFPVSLRDYFHWVNDDSRVDTIQSQNIHPIARKCAGGQWCFRPFEFPSDGIKNILFIRTDAIGDNLLAASMLPLLRAKYKEARVTVVCQKSNAELYEACPLVDRIISFDRARAYEDESYRTQILEQLRALKADLALNSVYSREPLTDVFTIGCNAIQKVAFNSHHCNYMTLRDRDRINPFYSILLPGDVPHKPELERHRDFLRGIGIDALSLQPMVWTAPDDEKFAEKFFRTENLRPEKTIALFAGSMWRQKIYRDYGKALAPICGENAFSVIALGAVHDREINQQNLDATGARALNLSGKTTLRQTAAMLRRCRLAVGADTGIAHLACAVGTSNVIILGGGHFGRFLPYSSLTSVVCLPLECYGCSWDCKYSTPHCIQDVSHESISTAIAQTLEKKSSKPRLFVQGSSLWKPEEGQPMWQAFDQFLDPAAVEIIPMGEIPMDSWVAWSDRIGRMGDSESSDQKYWTEVAKALDVANELRNTGRIEKAERVVAQAIKQYPRSCHLTRLQAELKFGMEKK